MTSLLKTEFHHDSSLGLFPMVILSQTPPTFQKLHHSVPAWRAFQNSWVVCLVFRRKFCKYLRTDMHKHPKRLTGDTDMWQWKALAFQCQCLSSENGLSEQAASYWWSRSQFDKAQRERPSFTTLGPIAWRGRGGTQQGARLGTEGQWKSRPSRPEGP